MLRYGPTIALVFVLAVAAIKAIVEDKKRHDEDRKTNNTTAHLVLEDGMSHCLCTTEGIESPHIRRKSIGQQFFLPSKFCKLVGIQLVIQQLASLFRLRFQTAICHRQIHPTKHTHARWLCKISQDSYPQKNLASCIRYCQGLQVEGHQSGANPRGQGQ